jgi:anti-sigma-K factor RskA
MSPDVHALTGAYVLDAVSDDERLDFEQHMRECPSCAQEVGELLETATRLGRAAAVVPPPRLKSAVMSQIRQVRQDPPQAAVIPLRRRRSWTNRLSATAAVVLLVVAGGLGVLLYQSQQRAEDAEARAAAISTILEEGDAQVVNENSRDGGTMTMLASRSADRALLLTEDMPRLDSDQDYQAWTIGEEIRSAGLIPEEGTTFSVNDIAAAGSIGITIEPEGGSPEPTTTDMIVAFPLS